MKPLVLAIQFMTRLPLPPVAADKRDMAAAIVWFPATGLVVGLAVWGAVWAGRLVDPWVGALGGVVAWAAITGALHLDGLGDMADAAGAAHKDPQRLRAVLADPHVGSFGVVAIVLQVLAKLVLIHALGPDRLVALLALPVVARIGPLVWTMALPPLHEGLGSLFRAGLRWWHLALWGLMAGAAVPVAPWMVVAVPGMALWGWWLARRVGGISGDGHGAGIELVESALLVALASWR